MPDARAHPPLTTAAVSRLLERKPIELLQRKRHELDSKMQRVTRHSRER